MNNTKEFDLVVIGGGSGGVRAARIAALHGAKVALCEKDRMGGTCVIRGCIPKKILFYSSQYQNILSNAGAYGWKIKNISKNYIKLVENKNIELKRLESIYAKNAKKGKTRGCRRNRPVGGGSRAGARPGCPSWGCGPCPTAPV